MTNAIGEHFFDSVELLEIYAAALKETDGEDYRAGLCYLFEKGDFVFENGEFRGISANHDEVKTAAKGKIRKRC